MKKVLIGNHYYNVDPILNHYVLSKPESSNVDFLGHDNFSQVLLQFHSGNTYLYQDVPKEIMDLIKNPETAETVIGNVHKHFKGIVFERFLRKLILPIDKEEQ